MSRSSCSTGATSSVSPSASGSGSPREDAAGSARRDRSERSISAGRRLRPVSRSSERELAGDYPAGIRCSSRRSSRASCFSPTSRARYELVHGLDSSSSRRTSGRGGGWSPAAEGPRRADRRPARRDRRGRRRHGLTLDSSRAPFGSEPGEPCCGDAPRPSLPAAGRRHPPPLRGLHRPGRTFAGYGLGLDERWRACRTSTSCSPRGCLPRSKRRRSRSPLRGSRADPPRCRPHGPRSGRAGRSSLPVLPEYELT